MSYVRLLWARRWLTALALVVAIIVGVLGTYRVSLALPPKLHARAHYVGEASAQVLIDTSHSQVADLNPSPAVPLYTRATLLADLLATSPIDHAIAQRMNIGFDQMKVTPPLGSIVAPIEPSPLGTAGVTSSRAAAGPYELTITIDPNLPIVAVATVAPTPARAQQLAAAAISIITQHVNTLATDQAVPTNERALVDQIGPPLAGAVERGPRKLYGVVEALVLFLLGTFAIVAATGSARRRAGKRVSAVHEVLDADPLESEEMTEPVTDVKGVHAVEPVPEPAHSARGAFLRPAEHR
jgi:hypothetical protein